MNLDCTFLFSKGHIKYPLRGDSKRKLEDYQLLIDDYTKAIEI